MREAAAGREARRRFFASGVAGPGHRDARGGGVCHLTDISLDHFHVHNIFCTKEIGQQHKLMS